MSLAKKFKTDSEAARSGVWVDFEDSPNPDSTIPGFKLARAHKQNKRYQRALRNVFKNLDYNADGTLDTDSVDEDEAETLLLNVFAETILIDWRNFQPNDDGVMMPYSAQAVKDIFGNADWVDLYDHLNEESKRVTVFNQKRAEAEAKN